VTRHDAQSFEVRERILETLVFPRRLMQGSIALETCTHAGHYAPRQADCAGCEHAPECEWLTGSDEHVDLRAKPTAALTEALLLSFAYVDARVTHDGHDPSHCRCSACLWLSEAERLLATLR
jgi:hypothetical protein